MYAGALDELDIAGEALEKAQGLARASYGWFRFRTGSYHEALPQLETAVARLRGCGDPSVLGWPLFFLGFAAQLTGDYERAEGLIRESVAVHRAVGDKRGALHAESATAFLWLFMGKEAAAQEEMERVAASDARSGQRSLSNRYNVHGLCSLALGDVERAAALFEKGLGVSRGLAPLSSRPGSRTPCSPPVASISRA